VDMVSPCLCSGSMEWIHESCLETLRLVNITTAMKCTICHAVYKQKGTLTRWMYCKVWFSVHADLIMCIVYMFLNYLGYFYVQHDHDGMFIHFLRRIYARTDDTDDKKVRFIIFCQITQCGLYPFIYFDYLPRFNLINVVLFLVASFLVFTINSHLRVVSQDDMLIAWLVLMILAAIDLGVAVAKEKEVDKRIIPLRGKVLDKSHRTKMSTFQRWVRRYIIPNIPYLKANGTLIWNEKSAVTSEKSVHPTHYMPLLLEELGADSKDEHFVYKGILFMWTEKSVLNVPRTFTFEGKMSRYYFTYTKIK